MYENEFHLHQIKCLKRNSICENGKKFSKLVRRSLSEEFELCSRNFKTIENIIRGSNNDLEVFNNSNYCRKTNHKNILYLFVFGYLHVRNDF